MSENAAVLPLGLVDRAALEYLKSKQPMLSFSYLDIWLNQHAYAFTVAKMMDADLLSDVQQAIGQAIKNGVGFEVFKRQMKPYLMAKGWWGEAVMLDPKDGVAKVVQVGSDRRLKLLFQTNVSTARAAARWQRIQSTAQALPYLRYNASHAQQPRESHQPYYGLILPVSHPLWRTIFPPNGYGCTCSVSQLTQAQAQEQGISGEPDLNYTTVINPRTQEAVRVPQGIEPSFAHHHVNRLDAVLDLYAERHGTLPDLMRQLDAHLFERIAGAKQADFSPLVPNPQRVQALMREAAGAHIQEHEARAAAQWEQHFNVRLQWAKGLDADCWQVSEAADANGRYTLGFLGTSNPTKAEVAALNQAWLESDIAWEQREAALLKRLESVAVLAIDWRYFNIAVKIKILAWVLILPKEKINKIVFITNG